MNRNTIYWLITNKLDKIYWFKFKTLKPMNFAKKLHWIFRLYFVQTSKFPVPGGFFCRAFFFSFFFFNIVNNNK
jgi:hypothetical protein